MSKDFCLLDEPWLPVRLADGRVTELGLLDVFKRSGEIVALAETAPPNLVAQYRLLLTITHRALSRALGSWKDKDRARWYREGLPVEEICAYLEHWRDRFWLFHPEYPFMQVAALDSCSETDAIYSPSTISVELFYGPEMFNQEVYQTKPWSPAMAVRSLLGYLQFVPGGFFPGKKLKTSEKAGALVNTAAVVPVGASLFKTLSLCLHPTPTGHGDEDLPAWEREPLAIAQLCGDPVLATGPNDRYTRQSRSVLFQRQSDRSISGLRFAAGLSLSEDDNAPDPMASFRAGTNGPMRISFAEGRALWRDLPALVPNPAGEGKSAAVLNYAIALHQLSSFDSVYQPLLVAGLASDQAKLLRWRAEQIVLPASLLIDAEKALYLRDLVAKAEALFGELRSLATSMLAETLPDSARKDTRTRARSQLDAGSFSASYFVVAERALPQVLHQIDINQPEQAETLWGSTLRFSALQSWEQLLTSLGNSVRALQADAKFWRRLHRLLNKHVPKTESNFIKEA